jgi:hypothetical protein
MKPHMQPSPSASDEMTDLKRQVETAVASEDFAKVARLGAKLKALKEEHIGDAIVLQVRLPIHPCRFTRGGAIRSTILWQKGRRSRRWDAPA